MRSWSGIILVKGGDQVIPFPGSFELTTTILGRARLEDASRGTRPVSGVVSFLFTTPLGDVSALETGLANSERAVEPPPSCEADMPPCSTHPQNKPAGGGPPRQPLRDLRTGLVWPKEGRLPWSIPREMRSDQQVASQSVCNRPDFASIFPRHPRNMARTTTIVATPDTAGRSTSILDLYASQIIVQNLQLQLVAFGFR